MKPNQTAPLASELSMLMKAIDTSKHKDYHAQNAHNEAQQQMLNASISVDTMFIMQADIICEVIANLCNTSIELLKSKSRECNEMEGRKIAYLAMRQLLPKVALRKIGAYLGGRDHSTVLHGIESMQDIIATEPHTKRLVNEVLAVAKYQIRLI